MKLLYSKEAVSDLGRLREFIADQTRQEVLNPEPSNCDEMRNAICDMRCEIRDVRRNSKFKTKDSKLAMTCVARRAM